MRGFFIILIVCALTPISATAQPGDPNLEFRHRWFTEAQDSVVEHPNDLFYKWVRLELLFNPYFTVHTAPTDSLVTFLKSSSQFHGYMADSIPMRRRTCYMCPYHNFKQYNPANQLGSFLLTNQDSLKLDLDLLVTSEIEFEDRWTVGMSGFFRAANKASFLLKRGQFQYVTGQTEKALNDFHAALESGPNEDYRKRILTCLVAYYMHQNGNTSQHYSSAMEYLNLLEPAMEHVSCNQGEEPAWYQYEHERLELMKRYGQSELFLAY
ncbi:MAG: hypothetical protein AAF193_08935, partial [Bacteroidota bacterium]